ncbi:4-hydroxythreonine-4-phosphate dehydrogenase [Thermanaeromonas toyohensis ToBE]|uniref:4-hydroxythreonine-4-phosphate dehydrogenase n=1 Tax=Thermanaeromonas toyohensis ToBE TaxID=698762 RepID=A0A1W1W0C6_9FIRM|nr:4-hydroxythreonine-4-phosphate dehydrogenase PdxA [Thermanaeromonas toyohensis]SMB98950.1 4-hydroxythreonine-4-phosphate dehydrogenase [Thermanaeromonas toyohensis ToBE]
MGSSWQAKKPLSGQKKQFYTTPNVVTSETANYQQSSQTKGEAWQKESLNPFSPRPVLAITMGDPAGIGPEIILKALSHQEIYEIASPLVIGSSITLKEELKTLPQNFGQLEINEIKDLSQARFQFPFVNVLDPSPLINPIVKGRVSAEAGAAAVAYVTYASQLAKAGLIAAIVTAPLNKQAMHLAGYTYPGHTELLAKLFNREKYCMVLAHEGLFVLHVTTHIAVGEVPKALSREKVLERIQIASALARALNMESKPIGVAGLNPHAGEGGLFGDEEIRIIKPAIEAAKTLGINVTGPWPADSLFPKARAGEFNFVVAMYHDQGHVPFKTLYFDEGVNITVGLPVVRTSVDHGTAFDIAGKGIAKEKSLMQAVKVAARLAPSWEEVNRHLYYGE